ncbi:PucR family transcriptional regulator [Brevibacterium marinum]|uniref:Purine catabolism regulator n=1 Tax=Brevibacterium marinum TaxID=418643 RepID=A0A846RZ18_9MICO|nr:PucR family transcriptional regulator [Brevibacterium marinum]NJC56695.1 purine catabolism regulator [Brevibacterium marinum]
MVTLGQLWARQELALDVVVDAANARAQEVTIVHSSELAEVDEWLAGGEVLLTIGVGQDLGGDGVGDYVTRLKRVGVHALGIGLGSALPWQTIPELLRDEAEAQGLALFGVPEPVPFVAVVDAFTRMREEETGRELTRASSAGRRFATDLAHQGPAALVGDLEGTLGAGVQFVSPTGRGLTGHDAGPLVRRELIAESLKPSMAPRLLRTGWGGPAESKESEPDHGESGLVEAVPVGDEHVRGWILAPAEAAGSPRTRSLLLSTAAALLSLSIAEQVPRRVESRLFATPLEVGEARVEWAQQTGLAPVPRVRFTVFGNVRGEDAEALMGDLGADTLLARAGSMLGVIEPDTRGAGHAESGTEQASAGHAESGTEHASAVDRVAEVTGLDRLFAKTIPLTQIHHTWTVWRTQHESATSDVRALLSSIDEAAAQRFVDRVLGTLLAARDGQDLLLTLRAFIAAGGVRDATAAELGIHRHTVRARMAKVETLLGRDLSQADSVQAVALAFELAEL